MKLKFRMCLVGSLYSLLLGACVFTGCAIDLGDDKNKGSEQNPGSGADDGTEDNTGGSSPESCQNCDTCEPDAGVVYVHPTGADDNIGSTASPKKTPQAGIDCANSKGASQVKLADGLYTVNGYSDVLNNEYGGIRIRPGIQLLCGYSSSDWNIRNISAQATIIRDTGDHGTFDNGPDAPTQAIIIANSSAGASTLVEGCVIEGGTEPNESAGLVIRAGATPTIRDNTIKGGAGTSFSSGIYVGENSGGLITDNTIDGQGDNITTYAHAIRTYRSHSLEIFDNRLSGGKGSTGSWGLSIYVTSATIHANMVTMGTSDVRYGIQSTGSTLDVYNNHFKNNEGGSTSSVTGLLMGSGEGNNNLKIYNNTFDTSAPASLSNTVMDISSGTSDVRNNIFYGGSGVTYSSCVETASSSFATTTNVANNSFAGCSIFYDPLFDDYETINSGNLCHWNGSSFECLDSPTGVNNVAATPSFNGDGTLSSSASSAIRFGGQSISLFSTDYSGSSRTGSWSIGADEK